MKKMKGYYDLESTFPDGLVVTDKAVAEYTERHLHPEDQKDLHRVVECALMSFSILSGAAEPPEEPWFYYDDLKSEVQN